MCPDILRVGHGHNRGEKGRDTLAAIAMLSSRSAEYAGFARVGTVEYSDILRVGLDLSNSRVCDRCGNGSKKQ